MEFVITFKNTNLAIKGERCLLNKNIHVTVMPLPSQIRAGCGICLRIPQHDIKKAVKALSENNINETEIYRRSEEGGEFVYEIIKDRSIFMEQKLCSLLDNCTSGGCGAKIGPGELSGLLQGLPSFYDENLLVGFSSSDDAAVYKFDNKYSIVSTADFFPPMVNDPKAFGKIAAANALSDVYAMGGRPVTALNLVCFPQTMDLSVLREILEGGAEKVKEAGASLAGGHSIYDKEPKYGLAVTGKVETDKIWRNNTPKLAHKLILTKPLGTGIIMAALRGGAASEGAVEKAVSTMQRLNKYAAEKAHGFDISACTDITGFGLLAHMLEMASQEVSIRLVPEKIPYIQEAYHYAEDFLISAAGQRNRNHLIGKADVSTLPFGLQELLFDPQTSGGLLLCVCAEQAGNLLAAIQEDEPDAQIIGEIIERQADTIVFDKAL